MLKNDIPKYYKVKRNQTVETIANAFFVTPNAIIEENRLEKEVEEGDVISIPKPKGNLYSVKLGDNEKLLCGSMENFQKKNGNISLFPSEKVYL